MYMYMHMYMYMYIYTWLEMRVCMNMSMYIYGRHQRLFGFRLRIICFKGVVWLNAWWKPCRVSGWASGLVQCLVETLPCFWLRQQFGSMFGGNLAVFLV